MTINRKMLLPHDEVFQEAFKRDPEFKELWESNTTKREVAKLIMGQRIKLRMTQKELAEKAGLKQPNIARIESGRLGSLETLSKIAQALNSKLEISFKPL